LRWGAFSASCGILNNPPERTLGTYFPPLRYRYVSAATGRWPDGSLIETAQLPRMISPRIPAGTR